MKKFNLFAWVAILIGGLCLAGSARVLAPQTGVQPAVTLYAVLKYGGDEQHKDCLNLATGVAEAANSRHQPCYLLYGFMSSGNDLDWFKTAVVDGDRSVIKDLGELGWTSRFEVPLMAALPKLAPGEHRQVTIDFSASGAPAGSSQVGRQLSPAERRAAENLPENRTLPENSSVYASMQPGDDDFLPRPYTSKKKHVERPTTDPQSIVAKASLGHIYVVHVADEANDFYALVRVDALERGDHCTISWRLIPAPDPKATRRK